jgi:hypothetical protein
MQLINFVLSLKEISGKFAENRGFRSGTTYRATVLWYHLFLLKPILQMITNRIRVNSQGLGDILVGPTLRLQ